MRIGSFAAIALAAAALEAAAASPAPAGRVAIDPVQVTFDKGWLQNMNATRGRLPAVSDDDARRIAADLAADLHEALGEALRARGFEVVSAPSAATIRLAARIDDLYVNAPDVATIGITTTYVRETGRATLRAEGRDPAGAVRMQTERRGTAGDHGRLGRASNVTNRFWFDALFRNWAGEVASELSRSAAR